MVLLDLLSFAQLVYLHRFTLRPCTPITHTLLPTQECTGGDLFERIIRSGNFSEQQAAQAFAHVASAVEHMHSFGVVHRDIKVRTRLRRRGGQALGSGVGKGKPARGGEHCLTRLGTGGVQGAV